jgi:hypothetical protein
MFPLVSPANIAHFFAESGGALETTVEAVKLAFPGSFVALPPEPESEPAAVHVLNTAIVSICWVFPEPEPKMHSD